jgi:ectoine hydroxylase-related dioxygenase (phytanoyl-CoA dioxygenase family)
MKAGDCCVFSRLTVHGSGPNATDEPRVGYAVQFYRNDVRAVWDNQPPRLLREHRRYPVTPVQRIEPPKKVVSLDGH